MLGCKLAKENNQKPQAYEFAKSFEVQYPSSEDSGVHPVVKIQLTNKMQKI